MNENGVTIYYQGNTNISIDAIPGHFVTSHSHINYYIDITSMKHRHMMAMDAAAEMAKRYEMNTLVNTIVCMDGSETIGSYLAQELSKPNVHSVNSNKNIYLVTPEYNSNGQMLFRDNLQPMISGKNVLILIASITTGKTMHRTLECVRYYDGRVAGISAIFSAIPEIEGVEIHPLFTREDIPGYSTYSFRDCPKCKAGEKIDALANSFGYSKI
ncbi:MAG: orotate phosphoribosyltransferase [Clostridiales bacterium]|uniref:Orotate phosphoribosyltransferase n=1 Tax=Harryflintia acetispora TaxID=1849041 RepID=A0A9X8Y8X1_9FIRM|nr:MULTISPECIES: orotate phosphoribosyltransferase [Oscillospiraceae]PWM39021.1 MAG: orotate phosphoribosyltransferase [Clostridiales bacterium]RGB69749.1 orotate phosphoribosyltransferase [Harryflintia acetispora]TCL44579.1 orotate phosphoribosyltransferase [Harryflintia acetispora]